MQNSDVNFLRKSFGSRLDIFTLSFVKFVKLIPKHKTINILLCLSREYRSVADPDLDLNPLGTVTFHLSRSRSIISELYNPVSKLSLRIKPLGRKCSDRTQFSTHKKMILQQKFTFEMNSKVASRSVQTPHAGSRSGSQKKVSDPQHWTILSNIAR